MIQQELDLKRGETREEILAIRNELPTVRLFRALGGMFVPASPAYWLFSALFLNLILISPAILVRAELGQTGIFVRSFAYGVAATEPVVLSLVVTHISIIRIFNDLADRIISQIQNVDDLSKFTLWLRSSWSLRNIMGFAVPFGAAWTAVGVKVLSVVVGQFAGWGFVFWSIIDGILAGIVIYTLLWICLLVSNLKQYRYEINCFLPADSGVIHEISKMQTKSIYMFAITAAVITFFITSSVIDQKLINAFSLPLLVIYWTIIAFQFFLTRATLSAIADRTRWETLDRIRIQLNSLEIEGDAFDRNASERFSRLVDLHKQVLASRISTFDLKSLSTLFSQLMLPLLALMLGNIDKILKLLP